MPDQKNILITGCSSGFGLLAAAHLASRGHSVYATMRDLSRSRDLVQSAREQGGESGLKIIPLDVTKPDSIRTAVAGIPAIDVLINNAGYGVGGFFEDLSDRDIREQFDVNFFGALNVSREVIPRMRKQKKGMIINITSLASFSGTPAFSAYCSSKWALEGFSECLYMELKPFGIDVCLVEPGSYRTRIFDDNARYAQSFDDPESPYFQKSQHLRSFIARHVQNNHRDPMEVVFILERLVNAVHPPFRNIVGIKAKIRYQLIRRLPFKLYAWLVSKAFSLKERHV
jgi:NAD(P)-dependent dehydrogenase (short-subunit alcohol dehydrogenase family)